MPGESQVASGDFTGDGRDDIAVLYNRGTTEAGVHQSALFTFASNGTDFAAPARCGPAPEPESGRR
nr:FG-GAP repeat protein [Streptomyces sp. SID14515]